MKPLLLGLPGSNVFSKRIVLVAFVALLSYLFLWLNISSKALPNTYVGGKNLGGIQMARSALEISALLDQKNSATFQSDQGETLVPLDELGITFDKQETLENFRQRAQDKSLLNIFAFVAAFSRERKVDPVFTIDYAVFHRAVADKFGSMEQSAQDANVFNLNGRWEAVAEKEGQVIDRSNLVHAIKKDLLNLTKEPIAIKLIDDTPAVFLKDLSKPLEKLDRLNNQTFQLSFGFDSWSLKPAQLAPMLFTAIPQDLARFGSVVNLGETIKFTDVYYEGKEAPEVEVLLDEGKFNLYLDDISKVLDRPKIDATLQFDGVKVQQFTPAVDGQELDRVGAIEAISAKISVDDISNENVYKINLPVNVTKAKVDNERINALGIRELVGKGVSYFAGSIANRAYNVALGASRINGTLVAPGEVFSFNSSVGEVSGKTGYKQAYVINAGRTVLDDGGGICQVSTTVYRAALDAGLPIVTRTGHAYRVGYYEQHGFKPGLDATVFSPSVDFQFKNDTGHHILVQSVYDAANARLEIDFYGTADGRRVEMTQPVIVSQSPALPEKRQDDPSLPKGTVKQVDFAAAGAQVFFTRKVYKEGKMTIDETVKTNYRPWAAVYLVGTQ